MFINDVTLGWGSMGGPWKDDLGWHGGMGTLEKMILGDMGEGDPKGSKKDYFIYEQPLKEVQYQSCYAIGPCYIVFILCPKLK